MSPQKIFYSGEGSAGLLTNLTSREHPDMSVPSYLDENPAAWIFDEPKNNQNNGKNVYVKSPDTKRNPRFQFPRCRVPFGVQDGKKEDGAPAGASAAAGQSSRKNLELSVDEASMVAWARRVDERMVSWITENCFNLFKREMKQSTVEALYRQLATPSNREGYAPLMRVKINASGKQVTRVMVVKDEGNPERGLPLRYATGTLDDITPQCHVIPIVEAAGLWIISKACGFTLVATDLLVFPAAEQGGFAFRLPGPAVKVEDGDDTGSNGPEVDPSVLAAPTVISRAGHADVSMAGSDAADEADDGN